jgi:hypothetical protein
MDYYIPSDASWQAKVNMAILRALLKDGQIPGLGQPMAKAKLLYPFSFAYTRFYKEIFTGV